uniref:DnaJ homolog subfamily B member 6-like n=1 Tax=Phallusia mammillata TaxID=59560 RepID=A0A6F9DBX9_9ASCI|nr:dnaJ homolog subfamily B member 6-like [Phallusia mammillata]
MIFYGLLTKPQALSLKRWPLACLFSTENKQHKIDHYALLGVERNATSKQLRDAFVKKSKELHPDLSSKNADSQSEFIAVKEAYSILSKPNTRRLYDAGLPVTSTVFDKSEKDTNSNGFKAGEQTHNPLRSKEYKNPYVKYNHARQVADRWTDYHNTYGTSRAQRRMQEGIDSPFWKDFWENSRELGGGGPQLPTHKRDPPVYWKKELVALICLFFFVGGVLTTLYFLYGNESNHPIAVISKMSNEYLYYKMSNKNIKDPPQH